MINSSVSESKTAFFFFFPKEKNFKALYMFVFCVFNITWKLYSLNICYDRKYMKW